MNRTQKYGTGRLHVNKYSSKSTRKEGQYVTLFAWDFGFRAAASLQGIQLLQGIQCLRSNDTSKHKRSIHRNRPTTERKIIINKPSAISSPSVALKQQESETNTIKNKSDSHIFWRLENDSANHPKDHAGCMGPGPIPRPEMNQWTGNDRV